MESHYVYSTKIFLHSNLWFWNFWSVLRLVFLDLFCSCCVGSLLLYAGSLVDVWDLSSLTGDQTHIPCIGRQFLFFFFFNLFIYFNWRLITLQYSSGFYHTLTRISHGCTCVPHSEPPSHLPLYPIPRGHPSAPALSVLSHGLNLDWRSISGRQILNHWITREVTPAHCKPLYTI